MKDLVESSKRNLPFFIRTPHALHKVFGPNGLRLHRGVSVHRQFAHVRLPGVGLGRFFDTDGVDNVGPLEERDVVREEGFDTGVIAEMVEDVVSRGV